MGVTIGSRDEWVGIEASPAVGRERWHRAHHRLIEAVVLALLIVGSTGWLLARSSGRPPNDGVPNLGSLFQISVPAGASLVSSHHVHGWTVKIYASPSGLTPATVRVTYEEFNSKGEQRGAGSSTLGASLLAPPGIVPCGTSAGTSDQEADCQITSPSIVLVRLMAGNSVLDAMTPVTYDGVRFVVLANFTKAVSNLVQGLDAQGRVVSTFQPDRSS